MAVASTKNSTIGPGGPWRGRTDLRGMHTASVIEFMLMGSSPHAATLAASLSTVCTSLLSLPAQSQTLDVQPTITVPS
jgi:hypothetical protein